MIGPVEDRHWEKEDERRHDDAEKIADLHLGGRSTKDVSDLQVLQHLTGDRRRDADYSRYSQHGSNTASARYSQSDHQQRRDHQRAKRESGHGIVRRTNHADQVAGNRSEEESHDEHDASRDQSNPTESWNWRGSRRR